MTVPAKRHVTERAKRHGMALCGIVGVGLSMAVAVACGDDGLLESLPAVSDGGRDPDARFGDGGLGPPIPANGLVIVHAASLPAFRLCFDANKSLRPVPSDQLMPSSNIVGVEVGTAVRVDPITPVIGAVWAFPEPKIRNLYPPGKPGPTCADLLESLGDEAIPLGAIDRDLSTGAHLLVVAGCQPTSADPVASNERCGETWTADAGNVSLRVIDIDAFARMDTTSLPIQIVQLSPALESRAAGRRISVALGDLDAAADPFITDDLPFADVVPETPMLVQYRPEDTASFASVGFHVSLASAADAGDAGLDAATTELLLRQSLADVARLSSSRDVPPEWFAAASSYVLLLVGEPDLADASPDDRRNMHLLAVPVAPPTNSTDAPATN